MTCYLDESGKRSVNFFYLTKAYGPIEVFSFTKF